jgi:predicted ATP-grasp superfamily ATP-dependent carboligase
VLDWDVPKFARIETQADVEAACDVVPFPAVLKPIHSHLFQRAFSRKLFLVNDAAELRDAAARALAKDIAMVLCERIPGPDDLLSSYYTYIDDAGRNLFRFTKRIIRRWPVNRGLACYHITEWLPETAEAGETFFRGIGFRGLGNVEFKRDVRDGKLKIIECNARFTAAQELLVRAGVDTGWLVYSHVTGRPVPRIDGYREHLRLWYPERDFNAYRELRRTGELGLFGWLRSIAHPQVLPHGDLGDPGPQLVHLGRRVRAFVARRRSALAAARGSAAASDPVAAPGANEP